MFARVKKKHLPMSLAGMTVNIIAQTENKGYYLIDVSHIRNLGHRGRLNLKDKLLVAKAQYNRLAKEGNLYWVIASSLEDIYMENEEE